MFYYINYIEEHDYKFKISLKILHDVVYLNNFIIMSNFIINILNFIQKIDIYSFLINKKYLKYIINNDS